MSAADVQQELHDLAMKLGEEQQHLFAECFGSDWPDEESTTAALFGALALSMRRASKVGSLGIELRASFTKKRDEAVNGTDVLIRFRCDEPEWRIGTTTLIQAKKLDAGATMVRAEHDRLTGQLRKMLSYTPEAFVLLYSVSSGIHAIPAVPALALGSRSLFDVATIDWSWFLSGVFRGRMGEFSGARLPGEGWEPTWVFDIVASATREEPMAEQAMALG
jgi:hypothetical protein